MLAYPLCKYANVTSCVFVISLYATAVHAYVCATRTIQGDSEEINIMIMRFFVSEIKLFLAIEWHKSLIAKKFFSPAIFNSIIIKRGQLTFISLRLYSSIEIIIKNSWDMYRILFSLRKEELRVRQPSILWWIHCPCYKRDCTWDCRVFLIAQMDTWSILIDLIGNSLL